MNITIVFAFVDIYRLLKHAQRGRSNRYWEHLDVDINHYGIGSNYLSSFLTFSKAHTYYLLFDHPTYQDGLSVVVTNSFYNYKSLRFC